jgi:hypothetical protein
MKKIKTTLLATLALCFLTFSSCTKFMENDSEENFSSISENIISDPLFEKLDEAFYKSQTDALKYGKEEINKSLDSKIKSDLKNKVFKTNQEYFKAKERAGYENFETRVKNKLAVAYYFNEILKKHPEFDRKEFMSFFIHNRKHSITREDIEDNNFKNLYDEYYKK